jgi:hypothetical protein
VIVTSGLAGGGGDWASEIKNTDVGVKEAKEKMLPIINNTAINSRPLILKVPLLCLSIYLNTECMKSA